ncbi:MAG TPA: MarR family transcriptional regulator [Sedimentisphaerales bacterium]|nr:MarR family transcriptional regulator [Sedimentisphaerales bacterium]HQG49273.1 MarR family transcriptional regulator [Sedimentisphaerales bacterium]HQI26796.1 MarR family transcriptional regulator [Sedimentisphaerales bacterium]
MSRQLFELILAVRRKCQGSEERIQRELGLSPAEFNALIVMADGEEITGCEFAERMALSLSRASRVLSKLVADGYLRTRPSPQDRRTILASLTPKGKRTRQRMFEHMEVCESRICSGLGQEKLGQVRNALELLERAL